MPSEKPPAGARNLTEPGQLDHLVHPATPYSGRPGERQQVVAVLSPYSLVRPSISIMMRSSHQS